MIKKLMIVMALVIMPVCMQAQQVKFGKVNKLEIFNMMPEKAIAEKQLQDLSDQYKAELKSYRTSLIANTATFKP